jgi:hypothetical protein
MMAMKKRVLIAAFLVAASPAAAQVSTSSNQQGRRQFAGLTGRQPSFNELCN